jgi:cytochrome c-type biogenesis protein CcmH/NrfF
VTRLLTAILVAAAAVAAPPALAAEPRASLPDIEDEVMCPICGTLLELSEAPQAERERVFIRNLIAAGATKEEIKDALVAEYGEEVLAAPEGEGFDLAAYVVPVLAFGLALVALAIGVRRWRRTAGPPEPDAGPRDGESSERIDSDMARYDL